MLVKVVLTIISSKVRAADNTASRLFYHFTSLSLNHHHPLLIIVISIHSSNPPPPSLSLSTFISLDSPIYRLLSLSFLFFFFLFNLCQICSAVHQLLLMMMMILPCCLSIFGSLSSLLLGWFCIFLS